MTKLFDKLKEFSSIMFLLYVHKRAHFIEFNLLWPWKSEKVNSQVHKHIVEFVKPRPKHGLERIWTETQACGDSKFDPLWDSKQMFYW